MSFLYTEVEDMTTGSTMRAHTIRFFVDDKPGALWEVTNEFGVGALKLI